MNLRIAADRGLGVGIDRGHGHARGPRPSASDGEADRHGFDALERADRGAAVRVDVKPMDRTGIRPDLGPIANLGPGVAADLGDSYGGPECTGYSGGSSQSRRMDRHIAFGCEDDLVSAKDARAVGLALDVGRHGAGIVYHYYRSGQADNPAETSCDRQHG